MKTFTYQVQTGSDATAWRAAGDLQVVNLGDDWTAFEVAKQAARDQEKIATDDAWQVVVWTRDMRGLRAREPYAAILGTDLSGDCWCNEWPAAAHGTFEWHCPSHGDRSWRPEAKAFQAGRAL